MILFSTSSRCAGLRLQLKHYLNRDQHFVHTINQFRIFLTYGLELSNNEVVGIEGPDAFGQGPTKVLGRRQGKIVCLYVHQRKNPFMFLCNVNSMVCINQKQLVKILKTHNSLL